MNTNAELYLQAACQKNATLRTQLERLRAELSITSTNLKRNVSEITEALDVEYTGFYVILKKIETGWKCLQIVESGNLPDDMEEEWDLVLPIPTPETIPDHSGW